VGCVIGAGIIFCIFTSSTNDGDTTQAIWLALITVTLHRPFEEQFYFSTQFLITALNIHVTTHFHCFNILHLKLITFLLIIVIFKLKNRFWFSEPYSLTLAVFFTTTLTSYGSILMNFLWIKLSFQTC
jgi:hypothetical protein